MQKEKGRKRGGKEKEGELRGGFERHGKGKYRRRRIAFGDMKWEVIGRRKGRRRKGGGKKMERGCKRDGAGERMERG